MNDEEMLRRLFPEGVYLIPEDQSSDPSDVDAPESPEVPVAAAPEPPAFRGENRKRVLVVHDGILDDDRETFLMKILAAVRLKPADIALIGADTPAEALQLIQAEKVLVFGPHPAWPSGEAYQPARHGDQVVLQSAGLDQVKNNREHKSLLWKALQQLFDL